MNTTLVVVVILLIVGAGLYVGVANFTTLYSVEPGGSNADQYACAPESETAKIGQNIKFVASVPEATGYFWSAPDAVSSFVIGGPLTAQYRRPGTKTALLFYVLNDRWYHTECSVVVK